MTQVVTNANMLEFIQNRSVPEFVAPDKPAELVNNEAKTPSEDLAKDDKKEQPRSADGKFVKSEETTQAKQADAPKSADDDSDDDLPERVKRIIGKKHRGMKEAEEFARERDRQAAVAEAEADRLRREIDELRKSGPQPTKRASDGEPKPEDFKTVAEYADALTEYKLEQKLGKYREEALQARQQQADATAQSEFIERLSKAREDIPDYDDVVSGAEQIVPPHIAQYIVESELGPHLGYHFAKHPEELERLAKLSPIKAIAEVGKLETKLERKAPAQPAAQPKQQQVSKAPSPITPLEGGSAAVTKDPKDMSFQELRAHRQAERAAGKR